MKEHICNSGAELAWQLADTIAQSLNAAINQRGQTVCRYSSSGRNVGVG